MITRREFINKIYAMLSFICLMKGRSYAGATANKKNENLIDRGITNSKNYNYGINTDGYSYVYGAIKGTPEQNMRQVIEKVGGIESIIDKNDIVVLKPNAQWWSQGMTNTDSMKAFIELVLNRSQFKGEIIIADNHHKKGLNSRAWNTLKRNGKYNYNELIEYFHRKGFENVSKCHWKDAGYNPRPLQGDDGGGVRIKGPHEGHGYVWREDIQYIAPNGHVCWMTYPVFKSSYSGLTIDLKEGVWQKTGYVNDPQIKFINFSALNHHGFYSGVTGSIKNLMGVVDMTCGLQAPQPEGTFNVHFVGVEPLIKYAWYAKRRWKLGFIKNMLRKFSYTHFEYTGGALGKFMNSIRMPDLNILTAEWVGWGSRTDVEKSTHPNALLISRDPVALDYIGARDVLLKATPDDKVDYLRLNDPSIKEGPFYKFLSECHAQGIGNLSLDKIKVDWAHIA